MRINRLFEIVYLLMNRKNMTANELAEHFEVSKRTIFRDVETLNAAGIPVYAMQGKGGGISILSRFILNKAVLSEDEQQQILVALQGMSAAWHMETEGILSRLRSLFDIADDDWIEVDFSRWGNSADDRAKFNSLKNAVINRRAISFTYSNAYGETAERKAYPLKLAYKSMSWYLQAFCLTKNGYRTFKINRMRHIRTLEDSFDKNEYHVPAMDQAEYGTGEEHLDLKLRFEPQTIYRILDEFNEKQISISADGSISVEISFPNDYGLYSYLLSYGDAVEVIAPQTVRDEMARQVEIVKNKYL